MVDVPDTRPGWVRAGPPPIAARDLAQRFANRLAALRAVSGLTVRELASRSGLPSGTVSALLTGRQQPNLGQLLALQRGFGMASVEELLGEAPSLGFGLTRPGQPSGSPTPTADGTKRD